MRSLALGGALAVATPTFGGTRRDDVARRIRGRTFPSVFQAWNKADHLKDEPELATAARHDLVFHAPEFFGLRWEGASRGLATRFRPDSVEPARSRREELLKLNPNLILIAEIRYRDAPANFLPKDHPWWMRKAGKVVAGWDEGRYLQLDFSNRDYRAHVAAQARAAVETGVVDGVMLDWWRDDEDRFALAKAIREAIGEDALILANANDRTTPRTAPFINGYFMECTRSHTAKDWERIAATLSWAEANLREPRINCLETWFHSSRQDLHLMRATTALALTHSDGYCLFSDPNPLPTPDHLHDWYAFWNKGLGKPKGPGKKREDGAFLREFERGFALYNPMGNREVTAEFAEPLTSRATGQRAEAHRIPACDGDILLRDGA